MHNIIIQIIQRFKRTRLPARAATPAPLPAPVIPRSLLTPRQSEVFALVSAGMPRTSVAARLGISIKTVDAHVCTAKQCLRSAGLL